MGWQARGVAARLCSVGRPAAVRSRRPVRQVLLGISPGAASRRKRNPVGSAAQQDGAQRHGDSRASSPSAAFLPDLVPCAGRRLRRTAPPEARDGGKDRADSSQPAGSTAEPQSGPSITGGLPAGHRRTPAPLPDSGGRPPAKGKDKVSPPTAPAQRKCPENSTTQTVPRSKKNTSTLTKNDLRRTKLARERLDISSNKLKPRLLVGSSDSEYMHMLPKLPSRKHEYANIDSCTSSYADGDSSASSGELADPVGDLSAILSGLRLRSDEGGRTLLVGARQRPDKVRSSGHPPTRRSKLPRTKEVALVTETVERIPRRHARQSLESSGSRGHSQQTLSKRSPERDHSSQERRSKLSSPSEFGYDIDNVSSFLSQATARTPANIPMVVTSCTELYVLSPAAPDRPTVTVQLGIVVNALFKRRQWVLVRTPHGREGYLAFSACSALGVLPRRTAASPWDWRQAGELQPPPPAAGSDRGWSPPRSPPAAADPRPNRTDTEKLYENVTSDGRALGLLVQQHVRQQRDLQRARRGQTRPAGTSSAFRRLPAAEVAPRSGRLVAPPGGRKVAPRTNNKAVIWDGFVSCGRNTLTVRRGDIVILLNTSVGDWFWVKDAAGREGYIPAVCVGSGLT